ncbi:MAG: porphobilinogen synthase [Deltaproteobacteria bacterium]|nr:porphobilinogen synthase [Deltaproteobacteria bacterium]
MRFPEVRARRLRKSKEIREMVRETRLCVKDFVYPLFVKEGIHMPVDVESMPGVQQLPLKDLVKQAKKAYSSGIPAVILFGIPSHKDEMGTEAYSEKGIIAQAIKAVKDAVPELVVIADACFCEYTSHGHCGVVDKEGRLLNEPTRELLKKEAYVYAEAGADVIAPSGMIDGMVSAIREALDGEGYEDVAIMSYSAKYASSFYGPFRDAAESSPQFGNRKTYQMDIANSREAIKEVMLDIEEGADIVMVKPALPYLDVIKEVSSRFPYIPLAAYNVSGEYAMVKAAGKLGYIDEDAVMMEMLTSIKRAGADIIITYFALDAARLL